jgi:hypothetical protein
MTETRKQQDDKQAKAQEQREKLLQEKNDHLRMLAKKVVIFVPLGHEYNTVVCLYIDLVYSYLC